jgi:peptide/nickel transport system permease protein
MSRKTTDPTGDASYRFETVEWDESDSSSLVGWRAATLLLAIAATIALFTYDYYVIPEFRPLVAEWNPKAEDWPFVVSLVIFGLYVLVPVARNRRLTRYYWRRLRTNRLAVASLAWLVVFFVLGLFAPVLVGAPEASPTAIHNPPVGMTVNNLLAGGCAGEVSNDLCHGSWAHPLGTTGGGRDVLEYTVAGMHTALQLALITATILVPIATAVGTVAAYVGGRVDELLMRYVDVQQVVPAFFVYIIAQFVFAPGLLLIVVVFGLLNWGGMARLVRSETLQKREEGYVMAARSAGSSSLNIIRRHIVPNVSNTLVTAVTLQLPLLILIEASLSFLSLGDPAVFSWGQIIGVGMVYFPYYWWVPTFPVIALGLTVVSLSLLGDALRDMFDPRTEA